MPKVSVIVPVYNVEKYLGRCLRSILNQTYDDYEVICINDCSPDHSQDILDKFKKKHPSKIQILKNHSNMGLGRTRENGIRHAAGEYILFIDSDDYIKKDYIQRYMEAMESKPCDIVIGGYIREVKGKRIIHKVPDSIWSTITYGISCAKMFRKNFIVENGLEFTDFKCGEDIYFTLCAFYAKPVYHVMDYAGYYYCYNPMSITGSMNYEKGHEKIIASIFQKFLDKHDIKMLPIKRQREIEYTYIANMVNALVTFGHGAGIKRMNEKYQYVMKDLNERFPDYRKNPFIGIFKPKGQTKKIRLGVGVTMTLHKMRLDRWMFYVISLL